MRLHIARDPSMSGDILRGLATGAGTDVQAYLATNPSTPSDVLRSLAASEDQDLRSCVAGNPATPSDILRLLATDLGTYVRVAVAANPATSADILRVMAADADADVVRLPVTPISGKLNGVVATRTSVMPIRREEPVLLEPRSDHHETTILPPLVMFRPVISADLNSLDPPPVE